MRLTKVVIRNFKRFDEITLELPNDSVVIAGPNNTGKTTLLQAISAWGLVLERWLRLDERQVKNSGYTPAPISRQDFFPVPLLKFADLWKGAKPTKGDLIEITLHFDDKAFPMEIRYDTSEQIFARPQKCDAWKEFLKNYHSDEVDGALPFPFFKREIFFNYNMVYVPVIGGITMDEPEYKPARIKQVIGRGRTCDILRNLLVNVYEKEGCWDVLSKAIKDIFGFDMVPPHSDGATIEANYKDDGVKLDIASGGSGFLQVLMLLSFLTVSSNAIFLLDEPDAHLHILLQRRVYRKIRDIAHANNCTLIMATHSESIINATDPRHLCVLLDKPTWLADNQGRDTFIDSLGRIDNVDVMLAKNASEVLYVERHTDIDILRGWAHVLEHPLLQFLEQPFWKRIAKNPADDEIGSMHQDEYEDEEKIRSNQHFDALRLVNPQIVGVELQGSNNQDDKRSLTELREIGNGLHSFYWGRYEIESYLIHPESIAYFLSCRGWQKQAGEQAMEHMSRHLPPNMLENPLDEHDYLNSASAKRILSRIFQAAGMENFEDYSQLAAAMPREAIHPEVIAKLDAIAEKFGLM